jgi:hypothetical protein
MIAENRRQEQEAAPGSRKQEHEAQSRIRFSIYHFPFLICHYFSIRPGHGCAREGVMDAQGKGSWMRKGRGCGS